MTSYDNGYTMGPQPVAFTSAPSYVGSHWNTAAAERGPTYNLTTGRLEQAPSKVATLSRFFGEPRGGRQNVDPHDDYDVENLDLPDAYVGKNSFMSQIIINRIQDSDLWPLTEVAKWRKYESGMVIEWDEWHFNDHMLGRTPEEGVSRLLSMKKTENRTSMCRFGIAFLLEHGFWKTEKGQRNYVMNLVQISNAIVETAAYGVIHTAINTAIYEDPNNKYRSNQHHRSKVDIDNQFRKELDQFAIIQKSEDGFDILVESIRNELEARTKVAPDVFVFPQGTRKFTKGRPEEKLWIYSGRKSGDERDVIGQAMGGAKYRESRGFKVGEHCPDEDPCFREQTIGTFFVVNDRGIKDVRAEDFCTGMLDHVFYNEDTDDWAQFSYKENAANLGCFTQFDELENPPLSFIGKNVFGKYETWGEWMQSTGKYDYVLAGLASKERRVQNEFIRKIVEPAAVASPSYKESTSKIVADLDRDLNKYRQKPSEQQKAYSGARADVVSQDSVIRYANSRGARLDPSYIQEVESHGLLDRFNTKIRGLERFPANLDATAVLADDYLQYDLKQSLKNVTTDGRFEPTALEERESSGANKRALSEAEHRSPQLQLDSHADVSTVSLYTSPFMTDAVPLEYNSQILTLSSTHLVALELDGEQIEQLRNRSGLLDLSNWKALPNDEPVKRDTIRAGLLQASVHLSAILHLVYNLQDQGDDGLHGLVEQIGAVLSRKQPRGGKTDTILKVVKALPILKSQRSLSGVINAAKRVLVNYYESGSLKDSDVASVITAFATQPHTGAFASATIGTVKKALVDPAVGEVSRRIDEDVDLEFNRFKLTLRPAGDEPLPYKNDVFVLFDSEIKDLIKLSKLRKRSDDSWKKFVTVADLLLQEPEDRLGVTPIDAGVIWFQIGAEFVDDPTTVWGRDFLQPTAVALVQQYINDGELKRMKKFKHDQFKAAYDAYTATYGAVSSSGIRSAPSSPGFLTLAQALKSGRTGDYGLTADEIHDIDLYRNAVKPLTAATAQDLRDNKAKDGKTISVIYSILNGGSSIKSLIDGAPALNSPAISAIVNDWDSRLPTSPASVSPPSDPPATGVSATEKLGADVFKGLLNKMPIVDGAIWKWFMLNHVLFPLGGIVWRPHITYLMGSGFAINSGSFASTVYGHADFMLADNAAQKLHYGHFTFYNKTIVWNSRYIVMMRNILCKDYIGGGGGRVWNPLDKNDRDDYRSNDLTRDMFYAPVPIGWKTDSFHLDITGRYHASISANRNVSESTHYPSADIMCAVWGFLNLKSPMDTAGSYSADTAPKFNTLAFQAHDFSYNHQTKGYTRVTMEKSHWGSRVYPGCGEVRRGQAKYLKPVSYDSTATFALIV